MNKVISADKAVELIKDGDTVLWTTAGLCGFWKQILRVI